ncbi:hypothetical protein [Nocardia sp. NPDC052316]|uniref:hypothetical protein n=1 Tax=Nocardia sp. NPDC052316 TaxID=3364329 RepID=UPI0037CA0462
MPITLISNRASVRSHSSSTACTSSRGSKGTQLTYSKTLGEEKSKNKPYWRIDVENPAPGKRAGTLHLQTTDGRGNNKDQKYQYNFNTKQLEDEYGAPPPRKYLDDISKDPKFDEAIQKGGYVIYWVMNKNAGETADWKYVDHE